MKKVIIATIIVIIIIGISYLATNSTLNIEQVLSKFETREGDGFYDSANSSKGAGYIVSNKMEDGYRYGYVNHKGKILLEPEYNQIHRVLEIKDKNKIYLIAAKNGRYGVNLNGKNIIKHEYQFIEYNNQIEGFILQKSENYGVADLKGNMILSVENDYIEVKGQYIYVTNSEGNKVYNKKRKRGAN